jgi:hypothetical protein
MYYIDGCRTMATLHVRGSFGDVTTTLLPPRIGRYRRGSYVIAIEWITRSVERKPPDQRHHPDHRQAEVT